jgi:hypothetical protein
MADHDRDAGSRGEEEAPRDPTPVGPTEELHQPDGLKYGEQAERAESHIPPAPPDPVPGEQGSAFKAFLRRRRTQVVGAGLAGLIVGGLLGGTTVAAFNDLTRDRFDRMDVWLEPHHRWGPHHDRGLPEGPGRICYRTENDARCAGPPGLDDSGDSSSEEAPTYFG